MNITFRRMDQCDISQIIKIERLLFPDPWSKESFLNDLRENEISYPFVIELDSKIIGYSICWYYFNELHIGNFAIHPDYQRQGYGTILLKKIFNTFKDYKIAYLEVRENNLSAIKLYNKFGFKRAYHRKKYYSNGEDAVIMIKYHRTDRSE
jgi:ribosomal-protein-alanine N-acetyltransferase